MSRRRSDMVQRQLNCLRTLSAAGPCGGPPNQRLSHLPRRPGATEKYRRVFKVERLQAAKGATGPGYLRAARRSLSPCPVGQQRPQMSFQQDLELIKRLEAMV